MSEDDPFSDMTPAQRRKELAELAEWEQQVSDGMTHAERAACLFDRFEEIFCAWFENRITDEEVSWLRIEFEKELANVERVARREERDGDD